MSDDSRSVTRREFLEQVAITIGGSLLVTACAPPRGSAPTAAGQVAATAVPLSTKVEKAELTIGFIPITCSTPVIMADPLGFYSRYGLGVTVKKFAGWADIRDAFIAKEIDAAHLLAPIPLATTLGLGGTQVPALLAAVQNINGQAITLANKFQATVRGPSDFRGLRMAVPFDFSMHNFLLRHYVSTGGVDPNRDMEIRVMRPPDMVANLASDNIDGYLGPDPFNQRAVFENVGFLHLLSKDLWNGHPCCGFVTSREFKERYPGTYTALSQAIVDASLYAHKPENRKQIAEAIAPQNYLNQPVEVIEAVLSGHFHDGKGQTLSDPNRIDFDPYPWKSFAAWMTSQMVRWGYVSAEQAATLDYRKLADDVFMTGDVRAALERAGAIAPADEYRKETIMGATFDAQNLAAWTQPRVSAYVGSPTA
jgi:nitrate/nitrite transport system substrate-binding protein